MGCPASGRGRVAVLPTLLEGKHPTIVYAQLSSPEPHTVVQLERYDVVTSQTSTIMVIEHSIIDYAQISHDGQWILFSAFDTFGVHSIQVVRVDGQDRQTLFCSDHLSDISWSPDQQRVAFVSSNGLSLLTLTNGTIRQVTRFDRLSYIPNTWRWINASQLAFVGTPPVAPGMPPYHGPYSRGLYLYDFSRSFPPAPILLTKSIVTEDAAFSPDGTCFFTSQYSGDLNTPTGPSRVQATSNGIPHTLYVSSTLAITQIRAITNTTLLLLMHRPGEDPYTNELWEMHTDGTGLHHILTEAFLFASPDQPWSSVSRDGTMSSLWLNFSHSYTATSQGLAYVALGSSHMTIFAQDQGVKMVGWTTM